MNLKYFYYYYFEFGNKKKFQIDEIKDILLIIYSLLKDFFCFYLLNFYYYLFIYLIKSNKYLNNC